MTRLPCTTTNYYYETCQDKALIEVLEEKHKCQAPILYSGKHLKMNHSLPECVNERILEVLCVCNIQPAPSMNSRFVVILLKWFVVIISTTENWKPNSLDHYKPLKQDHNNNNKISFLEEWETWGKYFFCSLWFWRIKFQGILPSDLLKNQQFFAILSLCFRGPWVTCCNG